ncbi:MAG TPA: hypothetical protein PKC87_01185 [Candidatus Absconditabacterales bacterium]|nr:hypothetical protein [Candidatus Absconditabacterales bacterium]
MKHYVLVLVSFIVFILAGCTSKSSFPLSFDKFTFTFYTTKEYSNQPLNTSTAGMKVLIEMKEKPGTGTTGLMSSIIIIETPLQSGIDMKTLVASNTEYLKLKLLKYVPISTIKKKVKCNTLQYSGYIKTFSYQLDKQTIYGGQYFFTDNKLVYVISLHTTEKKDTKQFIKSIETIKCIQ